MFPEATFHDEEGEQQQEEEDVEEGACCQDQLPSPHRPPPRTPSRAMLNLTICITMDTLVTGLQHTHIHETELMSIMNDITKELFQV